MSGKAIVFSVLLGLLCFSVGWFVSPRGTSATVHDHAEIAGTKKSSLWTCPMHPQIKLPDPGKCPICGMDLVPLVVDTAQSDASANPRRLEMSEASKKLAEIVTARVERKYVENEVRMVGIVDYDETRVRTISAWVPGRLDRLYVDFTGTRVRKGDHLVWLYSPEILTAQEELLEQKRFVEKARRERSDFLKDSSLRALDSARDKLRLWGLSDAQIQEIERRGAAEDHVMIPSPSKGIVIHKALDEGAYVKVGTPIYRIAELDHLWVQLDAYESDLPWVRYGQDVALETEALPGVVFHGWVSFVSPELDRRTRTIKVRVNVENPDEKLKPGMFVRAVVRARMAQGGKVIDPKLAGKWICPMHPAVVEDTQKPCRVCGMALVRAEDLGYVVTADPSTMPLVVPATAVLWTGKRAIVYVRVPDRSRPTYDGREIVLGPRAGDSYVVLFGLAEGERVVVHGNFKIDSALQLLAKPSMMSVPGQSISKARVPTVFREALRPVFEAYLAIGAALAADDAAKARSGYQRLGKAVARVHAVGLPDEAESTWLAQADVIAKAVVEVASSKGAEPMNALRTVFGKVSAGMVAIEDAIGHGGVRPLFELFCPMAFDGKGAAWIQVDQRVRNPYYGSAMLGCGDVRVVHPGSGTGTGLPKGATSKTPKSAASQPAGKQPAATPPRVVPVLKPVYEAYLSVHAALASDRLAEAKAAFGSLRKATADVDRTAFSGADRKLWMKLAKAVEASAGDGVAARDVALARVAFKRASGVMLEAAGHFLPGDTAEFVAVHCPMAFGGKGADWLQTKAPVRNPYFGAAMPGCGVVKRRFTTSGKGR